MKKIRVRLVAACILVIVMGLFSGCGTKHGSGTIEPKVVGPSKALTIEEQIEAVSNTAKGLPIYYQQVIDLASDTPNLSQKAQKRVDKLVKKYSARIEELANTDYSVMTEEELSKYYEEITEIVSAIREVDDYITLGV